VKCRKGRPFLVRSDWYSGGNSRKDVGWVDERWTENELYPCKSARVLLSPFILNQTLSSRSKETRGITPLRSLHVGGMKGC
jgi:hypothetical protein